MKLPDSAKRGIRTFVQAFVGVFVVQAVALLADANDGSIDGSLWQRVSVTAIVAGFIATVSWLQNVLEDADKIPNLMKPKDRAIGDAVIGK